MASPWPTPSAFGGETGTVILHPESGTDTFRRRMERPAQLGRYAFTVIGAVMAGAAAGLWIFHPSSVAYALLTFGGVMLGLAYAQHRLLLVERRHWPERAILQSEGIELVLANGELRVAEWNDPNFDLEAFVRPGGRGRPDEVFLGWRMDRKLPRLAITPQGLDQLRQAVDAHRLQTTEYRGGGGRRAMRGFEFRPFPPSTVKPISMDAEPERVTH